MDNGCSRWHSCHRVDAYRFGYGQSSTSRRIYSCEMKLVCFSHSIGKISIEYGRNMLHSNHRFVSYKSLAGWTFALSSYHEQNITRYLDDVYFQLMSIVIDPYSKNLLEIIGIEIILII